MHVSYTSEIKLQILSYVSIYEREFLGLATVEFERRNGRVRKRCNCRRFSGKFRWHTEDVDRGFWYPGIFGAP